MDRGDASHSFSLHRRKKERDRNFQLKEKRSVSFVFSALTYHVFIPSSPPHFLLLFLGFPFRPAENWANETEGSSFHFLSFFPNSLLGRS